MADWIPFVSQAKSVFQLISGDKNGAKTTQENFTRQCPGVSQLRSAVEYIDGDQVAALETQKEFIRNTSSIIDSVPLVGHVKGTVHYVVGDKEGGDNAMKSASRSVGTMVGGATGMLAGGPVGAMVGGITGGLALDSVTTAVDSEIHGEEKLSGMFKQIDDLQKNPKDSGKWFDTLIWFAGDAAAGYSAGMQADNSDTQKNLETSKNKLVKNVGQDAAKEGISHVSLVPDFDPFKISKVRNKQFKDSLSDPGFDTSLDSKRQFQNPNKDSDDLFLVHDFTRENTFEDDASTKPISNSNLPDYNKVDPQDEETSEESIMDGDEPFMLMEYRNQEFVIVTVNAQRKLK